MGFLVLFDWSQSDNTTKTGYLTKESTVKGFLFNEIRICIGSKKSGRKKYKKNGANIKYTSSLERHNEYP